MVFIRCVQAGRQKSLLHREKLFNSHFDKGSMNQKQLVLKFLLSVGATSIIAPEPSHAEGLWLCTEITTGKQRVTNTPTSSADRNCVELPEVRGRFSAMRTKPLDSLSRAKADEQRRVTAETLQPNLVDDLPDARRAKPAVRRDRNF